MSVIILLILVSFIFQTLHDDIVSLETPLSATATSAQPIIHNNPMDSAVSGQLSQARSRYQALVNHTQVHEDYCRKEINLHQYNQKRWVDIPLILKHTLLKKIKGTWSAPSLVCGHSQVQLLEDMHNCTSLKSLMFKKQLTLLAMSLTQPWHLFKG